MYSTGEFLEITRGEEILFDDVFGKLLNVKSEKHKVFI